MSSRAPGLCVWLALAFAPGCGRDAEAPPPLAVENPEPTLAPEAPFEPPPEPPPEPKVHGPRVDRCKAMGQDGKPVAEQSELPVDATFMVNPGDDCRLIYAADRVVTVIGPARVRVSPRGEDALLLRQGTLDLDFAPGAARTSAAFWVATPSMRSEQAQGTRLLLNASSSGASDVWVVSGVAHVTSIAGSAEAAVAATHGLSVSPSGKARPLVAKLSTLEEARAWMLARDRPAQPADVAKQLTLFDKALAALRTQEAVSARIADQHARLAQGDPQAMKLQRELATQEARVARDRRALIARADALSTWLLDPSFGQRAELEAVLGRANQARP